MIRAFLLSQALLGTVLGIYAVVAWGTSSGQPGLLITLATAGFLLGGLAFGKLEQRGR